MNETTTALLNYSKTSDPEFCWRNLATVLSDIYGPDMRLKDVICVVLKAYEDLQREPRFEVRLDITELILSPIESPSRLVLWPSLETTFSVEEWYNEILKTIMYKFRLSRIDWMKAAGV